MTDREFLIEVLPGWPDIVGYRFALPMFRMVMIEWIWRGETLQAHFHLDGDDIGLTVFRVGIHDAHWSFSSDEITDGPYTDPSPDDPAWWTQKQVEWLVEKYPPTNPRLGPVI